MEPDELIKGNNKILKSSKTGIIITLQQDFLEVCRNRKKIRKKGGRLNVKSQSGKLCKLWNLH